MMRRKGAEPKKYDELRTPATRSVVVALDDCVHFTPDHHVCERAALGPNSKELKNLKHESTAVLSFEQFALRLIASTLCALSIWGTLLLAIYIVWFAPAFPKMPGLMQVLVLCGPYCTFVYITGLFGLTYNHFARKFGVEDPVNDLDDHDHDD